MKVIIWIIALVLAIPTMGISLGVALLIVWFINKKEQETFTQTFTLAAHVAKNELLNTYSRYRTNNNLPASEYTESESLACILRCWAAIEEVLKESGRFHDNKEEVIQLACRFAAYVEDGYSQEYAIERMAYVADHGVRAELRRSHDDTEDHCNELPF